MPSSPVIEWGQKQFQVTVAIAVTPGDLIAYNGSAWVKADADTPATLWARGIAGHGVDGINQTELVCYREAIVYDADAPYTAGAKQYLSATAGAHTETRPTTVSHLRQVVGEALSTSRAHLMFEGLRELHVPIRLMSATSAVAALDSGNFGAPTLDAQNEIAYLTTTLPENMVSVAKAWLTLAAEATAGTPTMDITVSSAASGAQWDAVTADATQTGAVLEGSAADEIYQLDISTSLDATNIVRPGAELGIKCLKADAGTDISMIFGGVIVCNVV